MKTYTNIAVSQWAENMNENCFVMHDSFWVVFFLDKDVHQICIL